MLEKELIQSRGFRNTYDENGKANGFEVRMRLNYYRGCWLSQISHGYIIVDGEVYKQDDDRVTWIIGGKEYTRAEMVQDNKGFWEMTETAIIHIKKDGGLAQGYHDVEIHYYVSHSYMPPSMDQYEETDEGVIGRGYAPKRRLLMV